MAATIRASQAGLQRVDQARRKKGWNKSGQAWYQLSNTSKATLKRFWERKSIQTETFKSICKIVDIDDWEVIADFDFPQTSDLPLSKEEKFPITSSTQIPSHNLTDTQVDILKWLVAEVRADKLNEDDIYFYQTFNSKGIMDYQGIVPDMQLSSLHALKKESCIVISKINRTECQFALTRQAYQIADSIFEMEV